MLTRDRGTVPSFSAMGSQALLLDAETGKLTAPMRLVQVPGASARLVVRIHAASQWRAATDMFRPDDYPAPSPGPRFRVVTPVVNPRFIAVLLPLPAETEEPDVAFVSDSANRIVRIKWPGHTDTLLWSDSDGSVRLVDEP